MQSGIEEPSEEIRGHKYAQSNLSGTQTFFPSVKRPARSHPDRQYIGSVPRKSSAGHQVQAGAVDDAATPYVGNSPLSVPRGPIGEPDMHALVPWWLRGLHYYQIPH